MQPFARCPDAALRRVDFLFTDIDDTLTSEGRLTATAYAALENLAQAKVRVIPITGRPAGWCDHIARFWPVDGVVGENGAFWFRYDHAQRRMTKRFRADERERIENRRRLQTIGAKILAAVPGTALASDQLYRESDLAIDFAEDVGPLSGAEIDRIVGLMSAEGMTAKVSSIHVNGWFGDYDKLGMTRTMMREVYGIDLEKARDRCAFIGDSPNDSPMFGYFPLSVGVANVRAFTDRLSAEPRYVTRRAGGDGFAEFARRLRRLRTRWQKKNGEA